MSHERGNKVAKTRPPLAPPDDDGGPRRALVLSGGGMRVAYQAGAIHALHEAGLRFHHIDATSGGAMNAAMFLSGLSPEEACGRWRSLDVRDSLSLLPPWEYLRPLNMLALADADGLVERLFPRLGIDMERVRAAQGLVGTFNVCDFGTKTNLVILHESLDEDWLVAGMSLPLVLPPVQKHNSLYVDSAWIRDANPLEAVRRGADEVWVLWCFANSPVYQRGAFQQYVHMLELSAHGALFQDFERIKEINARIAAGEAVFGRTRPVILHLVRPDAPLPLDASLYLGRSDPGALVDMGYADARRYLGSMSPEGVAPEPRITFMPDAAIHVRVPLRMTGQLTWLEGDVTHDPISLALVATFRKSEGSVGDGCSTGLAGHLSSPHLGDDLHIGRGTVAFGEDGRKGSLTCDVYFHLRGTSHRLLALGGPAEDGNFRLAVRVHREQWGNGTAVAEGTLSLDPAALLDTLTMDVANGVDREAEDAARAWLLETLASHLGVAARTSSRLTRWWQTLRRLAPFLRP